MLHNGIITSDMLPQSTKQKSVDLVNVPSTPPPVRWWHRPYVYNTMIFLGIVISIFCVTSTLFLWTAPEVIVPLHDKVVEQIDDRIENRLGKVIDMLVDKTKDIHPDETSVSISTETSSIIVAPEGLEVIER